MDGLPIDGEIFDLVGIDKHFFQIPIFTLNGVDSDK